jgi:DNA-directed RNA polymerase specialized sigma24 family protein
MTSVEHENERAMASQGSVTRWIEELRAGDPAAAQPLWARYFRRLVGLARKWLRGAARRAADEEDVALSAFDSFCRRAAAGRFPQLADRDNLWHLLVAITVRKAHHLVRDERRQKRGGDTPRDRPDDEELRWVLGREPSPAFAAEVAEECRRLLDLLGEDDLRAVALHKMEGYTVDEIAAKLGCAPRTVARKLGLIRGLWEKAGGP